MRIFFEKEGNMLYSYEYAFQIINIWEDILSRYGHKKTNSV